MEETRGERLLLQLPVRCSWKIFNAAEGILLQWSKSKSRILFDVRLPTQCWKVHLDRLQTMLRKGNVFTSVCQEICRGGGVCQTRQNPPRQADTPPPQQTATGMHSCETCEEKFENLGSPLSLKDFQSYCSILLLYYHDLNICPVIPVFNVAVTMCVI